uniref:Uncharacterized protein n=1 Tax=Cacopsylla melanoneura TaxID=428564 RepID=A0A8D8STS0_9HEMI
MKFLICTSPVVVTQFAGVSKEDILAGVVPTDKETIQDTILALLLGTMATRKDPNPESNELDNLSKEDRIKLLIKTCDLPEGTKKLLPHIPYEEIKSVCLQEMTHLLLSNSKNNNTSQNGVPASIQHRGANPHGYTRSTHRYTLHRTMGPHPPM